MNKAQIRYLYLSLMIVVVSMFYSNCGSSGFQTSAGGSGNTPQGTGACNFPNGGVANLNRPSVPKGASGANMVAITLSAALTNQPTVTAKVCIPGTTQCQTIPGLLLDTGSTGLRIFSGAINLTLPQVADSQGFAVGTCAVYGDGSYQWGPVKTADVFLDGDVAADIPIEIIDASFGDKGVACAAQAGTGGHLDTMASGYNGIIGVQFFQQDCGSYCTSSVQGVGSAANGIYYGCCGSSCNSELVTTATELANPVATLNQDNNGAIIEMPAVSQTGGSVTGTMYLGIGTQTNNAGNATHIYAADPGAGTFYTTFNGSQVVAIIDSGSVAYFFSDTNIATCSGSTWYCPTNTQTLAATMADVNQAHALSVSFYVANAMNLNGSYSCFNDLAAQLPSGIPAGSIGFIWGFPFFLGRNVYVGIENTSSNLGAGPLWAF